MTNDKTVTMSRELVELITKEPCSVDDQVRKMNAIDELRALLAASDMSERIKSAACPECASRPCICIAIAAPVVEHQPVAWIKEHLSGKSADFHYKTLVDVVFKEDWKPLFASPPTPVSVVLPERMTREQALELTDYPPESAMYWYNKALDDVLACLNKVKELNQ